MDLKHQMIQTLIDGDFEQCNSLKDELFVKGLEDHEIKRKKFDELMAVKDRSRLINLIYETDVLPEISSQIQEILMKGVDNLLPALRMAAYSYYSVHEFEDTPLIVEAMRKVVAEYLGVSAA